jgi:hypothetical protein
MAEAIIPQTMTFHVNGPAIILVGKQGNLSGPLLPLGISEDGADMAIHCYDAPIMTDARGSGVPHDLQDMGRDAEIGLKLPLYDDAVLRTILEGRANGEGWDREPGSVIFAQGLGFRLVIDSNNEQPIRFPFCTLRASQSVKLGTRRKLWSLGIYASRQVLNGKLRLFDRIKA